MYDEVQMLTRIWTSHNYKQWWSYYVGWHTNAIVLKVWLLFHAITPCPITKNHCCSIPQTPQYTISVNCLGGVQTHTKWPNLSLNELWQQTYFNTHILWRLLSFFSFFRWNVHFINHHHYHWFRLSFEITLTSLITLNNLIIDNIRKVKSITFFIKQ